MNENSFVYTAYARILSRANVHSGTLPFDRFNSNLNK